MKFPSYATRSCNKGIKNTEINKNVLLDCKNCLASLKTPVNTKTCVCLDMSVYHFEVIKYYNMSILFVIIRTRSKNKRALDTIK